MTLAPPLIRRWSTAASTLRSRSTPGKACRRSLEGVTTRLPLCGLRRSRDEHDAHRLQPGISGRQAGTSPQDAFPQATRKGYDFAVDRPDEAVDLMIAANSDALTNPALVRPR